MGAFPLVPLFQNFQKWPICVSLTNLLYLTSACTFRAAVSAKKFSKDCTLSPYLLAESAICADVTLEALNSNYFLGAFPLVPPLQNFKKKGRFGCPFPTEIKQIGQGHPNRPFFEILQRGTQGKSAQKVGRP